MTEELKRLQNFVNQMKATSSLNEKKEIIASIKDDEFIKETLQYALDPYKKYYVTSKNCKKNPHLICTVKGCHLFDMLDGFNDRFSTGHNAIADVNGFISQHPEHEDLIYSIIDRNLKIRASESVINKIIPNLIPTFDVALATKFEPKFCDFENEDWFASRKLDGVRCIIRKEGDNIVAYSRVGNVFTTLGNLLQEVLKIPGNFVLDGEICLMDEDGNEDFQGIMKQIKKKNHTIENPKYIVFDCLTTKDFDNKFSEDILSERMRSCIMQDIEYLTFNHLEILDQEYVRDANHLSEMLALAEASGYEGVMLRKDTTYEGKRSKNLLKCKKFYDAEYKVMGAVNGPFRVIENGQEKEINVLSAVTIEHKGHVVSVGSGFSLDQRKEFGDEHLNIVGKIITVQYFEETKNQEGGLSLRFPTVKHVYENGRNV